MVTLADAPVEKLVVILIMPSSYDSDGYVNRYQWGVLPSNTLVVMDTLTRAAVEKMQSESGDQLTAEIYMLEDGLRADARQLKRLENRFCRQPSGVKLVVGLVGVQTRQFPRACDLISRWQKLGAVCVIGGFHVSGSIATMYDGISAGDISRPNVPCPHIMPPEVQMLMEKGVIIFSGEAESLWQQVLRDIINGTPQLLYRGQRPPLLRAPLPNHMPAYVRKFATRLTTIDTGRGCPYPCSFCTIINVQGRDPRWRDPRQIIAFVREQCEIYGRASFFFTDDNFVRNPEWEVILDGLIGLRQAGRNISFMLEADLHCGDEPRFLEKAFVAGCTQIFMGVESMNKKSLKSARKNQNHVDTYAELWRRCRELGIAVHAGYIIGFPYDTPASVAADIEQLTALGADQVSLFMLTPLPGSEDHIRAFCSGVKMDSDFNNYDSFQPAWEHPAAAGITAMTRAEWLDTYRRAWKKTYSVRNMVMMLQRHSNRHTRRCLVKNYIWYRWAVWTELSHPMVAGLYRLRPLADRRPNAVPVSLTRHRGSEIWRHLRYVGCFLREFYIFQHVFYEVEVVPYLTESQQYLTGELRGASDWFARTFWQPMNRRWLNSFWIQYGRQKWNLLKLWHWRSWRWHLSMLPYAVTETVYTSRWLFCFWRVIAEVR